MVKHVNLPGTYCFIHIHYRLYTKYHAGHLDAVAFDEREPERLLLAKK